MADIDPINERYEKQKEKMDRLHAVLEETYNETHYFERIMALSAGIKQRAYERLNDPMDPQKHEMGYIEFAATLVHDVEMSYMSLNDNELQEYVDELFGNYIQYLSDNVLIAGKSAKKVRELAGVIKVKPFEARQYKLPDDFGRGLINQVGQIINRIAAAFKYHAIKEFMEAYNATMITMMTVCNRATEQLIQALQDMEIAERDNTVNIGGAEDNVE